MWSKKLNILVILFVLFSIPTFAQKKDDAQKQREEFEQKAIEDLNQRIKNFLLDLQADDFQKEIIKQKMWSYYEKKRAIFMDGTLKYYERDEQLTELDASHFLELKNMLSENTMEKIHLFIKDAGTTLKKQKKKKNKKEE